MVSGPIKWGPYFIMTLGVEHVVVRCSDAIGMLASSRCER